MKITVTYNDGKVIESLNEEDFETAVNDIKKYTEEHRNNPYAIKSITIESTFNSQTEGVL
jgi:hypothetical protein